MNRRAFLSGSVLLVGCGAASHAGAKPDDDDDVTPAEDLMREHGVLRRVMYMYDEAAARFDAKVDVPLDALAACAGIVRHVIEDYHEKLEENYLFPRFEKAGVHADLTATLRKQHEVGRGLTEQIQRAPTAELLRRFNHMYRAHAAREDTVLFPALHQIIGKKAYAELGEMFEAQETKMLGDHGFEHAVDQVAKLEQAFGVDDLAKLT